MVFDGAGLVDAAGQPIDPDGDGQPGGSYSLAFATTGISGLPGTGVEGRVFASEKNPDGSNQPLANVTITVDGAEETLRATTTTDSGFSASSRHRPDEFFVHVDGRTAAGSQWPDGVYYPFVGKAWEAVAGRTNNLANGTGEVFLPRIGSDTLQTVSATETKVTFSAAVLAGNPALAGVEVNIPPNALFGENGARGGKVGIAPVPPDRLPEPLPARTQPAARHHHKSPPAELGSNQSVRFPNLPDPVTGA